MPGRPLWKQACDQALDWLDSPRSRRWLLRVQPHPAPSYRPVAVPSIGPLPAAVWGVSCAICEYRSVTTGWGVLRPALAWICVLAASLILVSCSSPHGSATPKERLQGFCMQMRHTYSAVLSTFELPMGAPRADREMSRFMNDLSGAIKRAPTPYFGTFLGCHVGRILIRSLTCQVGFAVRDCAELQRVLPTVDKSELSIEAMDVRAGVTESCESECR